ncbi:hypothetical protein D3C78_1000940 [compost metagenome]
MLVAQGPQAFEETRCRRHAVHVAGHWLDDDAGHVLADFGEHGFYRVDVVERQGQGVFGECRRYTGRARYALGQCAGTGLDQQAVGVTVVAAFELDDAVAAGEATGQANGAHGRFGAGADHAHHFHRRHEGADQVGHLRFHLGRRAVGQAVLQLLAHRVQHIRMAVAEDHRAPGADVIHIALVVFVGDVGAFGVLEEQRRAADALERANRRVHATGNVFLGIGKQRFGTRHDRVLRF